MNGYEFWKEYRQHPTVDSYCSHKELTKLRQFFEKLQQPVIHPKYRTFVRSGRASCSNPNVQQLPRDNNIREAIVAGPGCLLFVIDYSSVELKALAHICYTRFGFSKLRDVIKAGIDPHSYTAAMFAGVTLDEFQQLPNRKGLRQCAKAINFGFPAGLGAKTLVGYAKHSYGVTITEQEATEFRRKLTEQVYPELKLYLAGKAARETVVTTTGRIRGNVSYTSARNTPFQGLAADGAKLAVFELLKAGYRIRGFVHDEYLVELSRLDDRTAAARHIERIFCDTMQQLVGDIPVECGYALAERWYKAAEAVFDAQGRLQPWKPERKE